MPFQDHFSGHAREYASFRPTYPPELAAWLAGLAPSRQVAWDCGTGSGQAARLVAEHFALVVATDPSRQQLQSAPRHSRVAYVAATAEHPPLADASVDLVTVAQALHWFDFAAFYAQVRRVCRRGGILAVWAYELARVSPEVDRWLDAYFKLVEAYWPPERRYVEEGYRTIPFPFAEISAPVFSMQAEWSLDQLLGYLSTWSATKRATQSLGYDVLSRAAAGTDFAAGSLEAAWGEAERRLMVWPLILRLGRVFGK